MVSKGEWFYVVPCQYFFLFVFIFWGESLFRPSLQETELDPRHREPFSAVLHKWYQHIAPQKCFSAPSNGNWNHLWEKQNPTQDVENHFLQFHARGRNTLHTDMFITTKQSKNYRKRRLQFPYIERKKNEIAVKKRCPAHKHSLKARFIL